MSDGNILYGCPFVLNRFCDNGKFEHNMGTVLQCRAWKEEIDLPKSETEPEIPAVKEPGYCLLIGKKETISDRISKCVTTSFYTK